MITLARNWDSLCLYAWRPHMYNPQLKHWLHRIAVPTLVLWGASDRIVTPDYGRAYSSADPRRAVRGRSRRPATIPNWSSRAPSSTRSRDFCEEPSS